MHSATIIVIRDQGACFAQRGTTTSASAAFVALTQRSETQKKSKGPRGPWSARRFGDL